MRKTSSEMDSIPNSKTDLNNSERDTHGSKPHIPKSSAMMVPMGINNVNSNGMISPHSDIFQGKPRSTSSSSGQAQDLKLNNMIREMFIDIRKKTLSENQNAILLLKNLMPMDNDDDKIIDTDPLTIMSYIRQMFTVYVQLKNEAERELLEKKESEGSDYEPMLQKLESEVRQHIRIEQQLKLYVESTQSKSDEIEKQNEQLKKELESIKHENNEITEQNKKKEIELDALKKELKKKVEIIQNLEQQMETIQQPLKQKIKELERERQVALELNKSNSYNNALKILNSGGLRDSTDGNLRNSTNSYIQNTNTQDSVKKHSQIPNQQPAINITNNNSSTSCNSNVSDAYKSKHVLPKDKENIDLSKMNPSSRPNNMAVKGCSSSNSNYLLEKRYNQDNGRIDRSTNIGKYEEKADEFDGTMSKPKKSSRNEHGTSRERLLENDIAQEDRLSYYNPRTSYLRTSENMESNGKYGLDRSCVSSGTNNGAIGSNISVNSNGANNNHLNNNNGLDKQALRKYGYKESEDDDYEKNKYKRNLSNDKSSTASSYGIQENANRQVLQPKKTNYQQSTENPSDLLYNNQLKGNNIPKPVKNNEHIMSSCGYPMEDPRNQIMQAYGIKRDGIMNSQDLKSKLVSPNKSLQDSRSHSVDGTNKFYRQLKSKGDSNNANNPLSNENMNMMDYPRSNSKGHNNSNGIPTNSNSGLNGYMKNYNYGI